MQGGQERGVGVPARARRASCAGGRVSSSRTTSGTDGRRGGYLGVDTFFVLSGFLITSLLLAEFRRDGRIDLSSFWARRARRLLPALFIGARGRRGVREVGGCGASRGSALRGTGWRRSSTPPTRGSSSSTARTSASSRPVECSSTHVVARDRGAALPALATDRLGCLLLGRGRRAPTPRSLAAGSVVASALLMAHLASGDPSRVTSGTDTRVHSLLVGALLALVLERWPVKPNGEGGRVLRGMGVSRCSPSVAAYVTIGDGQLFMYRGGFRVFALVVAIVIAAAVRRAGRACGALLRPAGVDRHRSRTACTCGTGRCSSSHTESHWPRRRHARPRSRGGDGRLRHHLVLRCGAASGAASRSEVASRSRAPSRSPVASQPSW